jgi:hypothetical protein
MLPHIQKTQKVMQMLGHLSVIATKTWVFFLVVLRSLLGELISDILLSFR